MIGLVAVASIAGWGQADSNHELVWSRAVVGAGFVAAWFNWVSRPIFLLVILAWLWRLIVVTWLFRQIASLDLRLAPTHPDRAGGLGFVEALPAAFAPFFFGVALVVAARWGHEAMYHGLLVGDLQLPAAMLVAASVLIGLAPLVVFVGRLMALKRRSQIAAGTLLADYGRFFALAAGLPLVPVFATQMPLKEALFKVLAPLIGL